MNPRACSVRVITLVCLLFGSLMYTSYSAVLVSRLATLRAETPFQDLNDVLAKKTHSLCVRTNSYAYGLFKNEKGDIKQDWRQLLNAPPCHYNPNDSPDIAKGLCNDKTVTMESENVMGIISKGLTECSVTQMNTKYAFSFLSILAKKNFPYMKLIAMYFLRLHRAGLIALFRYRWFSRNIPKDPTVTLGDVTIDHIKSVLTFYFCAICCSLAILCLELIWYYTVDSEWFLKIAKRIYEWKPHTA